MLLMGGKEGMCMGAVHGCIQNLKPLDTAWR